MKYIYLLFTCFSITFLIAQEENLSIQDSAVVSEKSLFIGDYSNRLNIKLEASNEIKEYLYPYHEKTVKLVPNLAIRYALVFNYRFLSVSIGFRPNLSLVSREEKGETDMFQIKIKLLFNKWSHQFKYIRVKGYYVLNSDEIDPIISEGDNYVQFPDLTTHVFAGTSAYTLNDNYSIKASQSQTEIQLKSAGSFMPSVDYSVYLFNGADKITDGNGDEINRLIHSDYLGFSTVFNIGYYYTFVMKKWYINVYANPGIGFDFYKETTYNPNETTIDYQNAFVFSVRGGVGIGYNSDKFYFGANYINGYTNQNVRESDLQFQSIKNSLFIFFGYRFKAPKPLSKPMDYIEEKVPMLK